MLPMALFLWPLSTLNCHTHTRPQGHTEKEATCRGRDLGFAPGWPELSGPLRVDGMTAGEFSG